MNEFVIIPTYRRNHYLHCALKRIREQDRIVPIMVFSDRGEDNQELRDVCRAFLAGLKIMPIHDYYGNSYCVMEAFRWAYENQVNLVHFSEDDFIQKPGCLSWHRKMHQQFDDIFCACGWVFNRQAPITDDVMFAPWYYSPNCSVRKEKLKQIVKHANPLYYNDLRGYVLKTFPDSMLHARGLQEQTGFYEQDAVWQYCIEADKSQVAWNGIAKGAHLGASGYNRPSGPEFEGTLRERIQQVEELLADEYWRAELFGREVVEREIGRELVKREFRYRIEVPGGWQSDFTSELKRERLPKRINSVNLPVGTVLELAE